MSKQNDEILTDIADPLKYNKNKIKTFRYFNSKNLYLTKAKSKMKY